MGAKSPQERLFWDARLAGPVFSSSHILSPDRPVAYRQANSIAMPEWSPFSWQNKPVAQYVEYPDQKEYSAVLQRLTRLPPLVTSWEVESLKSYLADASRGRRFLVQGGDCAERFEDCESDRIAGKLKILLKMSIVLLYGSKKPVIRVGRFAGQYAKPRSSPTETRDGITLPSYRGPLVNRPGFSEEERTPDPQLMLRAYEHSAMTLNFIRGLIDGGFADLRHPELWDLDFVNHAKMSAEYQSTVGAIGEAMTFFEAVAEHSVGELNRVDFFTSHEGLQLAYEATQTRRVPRRTGWYNLHTHFPWIGDRTRDLGGAHVEFFRGIENPIGVKIGPTCTPMSYSRWPTFSTPTTSPAASHSSTVSEWGGSRSIFRRWSKQSSGRKGTCSGSAIPCTATPSRPPAV